MGFFSKLNPFKKKDDFGDLGKDLGLGNDAGMDLGFSRELGMGLDMPPGQQQPFQKYPSFQPSPQFQPSFNAPSYSPPSYPAQYNDNKSLEVISSKLDALKASLESINVRLSNIESIARGEQEEQRGRRRYY